MKKPASLLLKRSLRHPCESEDPGSMVNHWILAFARMTRKRINAIVKIGAFLFLISISFITQSAHAKYSRLESSTVNTPDGELIWNDFRRYFEIPYDEQREEIQQQIKFYQSHKRFFYAVLEQAAPYISYIYQQTRKRGLPSELALVPFVESGYNAFAFSRVGAVGLWQLMPGTASVFGLKIDWWYDDRRDIMASTRTALDYLSYLHDFFDRNWVLAIAAYDSGEGTVRNSVKRNLKLHKSISYWNLSLPKETKGYLPKLLAVVSIIKHPKKYNMELPLIVKGPYFKNIEIKDITHLPQVAKLADINLETLYYYNPGYRRIAAGPKGSFNFLVPINKAKKLETKLKKQQGKAPVEWHRYAIKKGDSLSTIAKRYHTTVGVLKQVNHLKSDALKIDQHILVPNSFQVGMVKALSHAKRKTIEADHHPGPKQYTHKVKRYETFSSIAKRYQVKITEIKRWNRLNYKHTLKAGEELTIWSKRRLTKRQLVIETHKIKKGDSLIKLAKLYHTSVKDIKIQNKLKNNNIRIGKTLKIPTHIDISL